MKNAAAALNMTYKFHRSILSSITELNNRADRFGDGNSDIIMDEQ
jgi:hypothetical protein